MKALNLANVLLLCSADAEAELVKEILDECVHLTRVRNLIELTEQTEQSRFDAALVGCSFHQNRYNDAVEAIRIIRGDLPIIFVSWPDDAEWKQMLEARGFELLLPFCSESEIRAESEQAVEVCRVPLEESPAIFIAT